MDDIDSGIDYPVNIWISAGDGDLARVQEFIAGGQSVDAQDENGYSPLCVLDFVASFEPQLRSAFHFF